MGRRVVLVKPEAPPRAASTKLGRRLASLKGARLAVLDNSKANADLLLADVVEGLRSAHGVAPVLVRRKAHPSYPAPAEMLDELAREADCVVTAMGD